MRDNLKSEHTPTEKAVNTALQPASTFGQAWPRPLLGWWVVALLLLVGMLGMLDQIIMSLMVDPIKTALGLSDTQMGLVQGPAFGVATALSVIPCGWLVDRVNRCKFMAMGVTFWSLMTAMCGLASGFGTLVLARACVGMGEATLRPTPPSLISDCFPPPQRPLAIGVFTLFGPIGVGSAVIIGGYVAAAILGNPSVSLPVFGTVESWRAVFLGVALPGILLGALLLFLREPARQEVHCDESAHGMRGFFRGHWRVVLPHFAGVAITSGLLQGIMNWVPAFFIRTFAWNPATVGLRFGLTFLIAGVTGTLCVSFIAKTRRQRGRVNANLSTLSGIVALATVPAFAAPLMSDASTVLALFGVTTFLIAGVLALSFAAIVDYTPNRLRGRVSAIFTLGISLLGTLGPAFVGFGGDHLFAGRGGIGAALAALGLFCIPGAILIGVSARQQRRAIESRSKVSRQMSSEDLSHVGV